MTREEAIQYIDGLHVVPCEQLKEFCDERNEAIDMAIEALQTDAEPKWSCTANFVAEQLDRLSNMTDEERWDFFIKFFSPSAEQVTSKLNNPCDSLLTDDSAEYKEQKSKLESTDDAHVVYCKDCKWWSGSVNTSHNNHLCKRALDQNVEYWVRSDDYCSYSERKGGDTE